MRTWPEWGLLNDDAGERMRFVLASILVLAALIEASLAFGAGNSPSHTVYQSGGKNVQSTLGAFTPPSSGGKAGTTSSQQGSSNQVAVTSSSQPTTTLPFTGLDLTLIVLAGVGLVVTGFALRRMTRQPNS
jgi:ABC-type Fe3+-siderophore transport system permease subunit